MLKALAMMIFMPFAAQAADPPSLNSIRDKFPETTQLIWVRSSETYKSTARLWVFDGSAWNPLGAEFPVVIGRNGSTPAASKHEGDGKTPEGSYPITELFGRGPRKGLKLKYTMIDSADKWVDDSASPDYNHFVRGDTTASSFEQLQRPDRQYDLFGVIGYNMNPAVPGKGSAIFMHIRPNEDKGTAGCVSMDPTQLGRVVDWMDGALKPVILIGQP